MNEARLDRLTPAAIVAVVTHLIVLWALGLLPFGSRDVVRPAIAGSRAHAPIPVLIDSVTKPPTLLRPSRPMALFEPVFSRPTPASYRPPATGLASPRITDDTSPGKTGSSETGSGKTGPGKTGPGKTGPGKTGPGKTGPGKTGPGKTVPFHSRTVARRPPVDLAQAVRPRAPRPTSSPSVASTRPWSPPVRTPATRLPQSDLVRIEIRARDRLGKILSASYPTLCARQGHQGTTVVRLTIGSDGKARDVSVVSSAGCRRLDRTLRDALSDWRFDLKSRTGLPVETVCELEAVWKLADTS